MPLNLNFSFGNIVAGLLFSGLGFVAFTYGKKTGQFKMMGLGGALMVYCYFTPTALATWLVGAALTAGVWYARE